MVQDVKDQRLKANHNGIESDYQGLRVVQDVKDQRLKANHNNSRFISDLLIVVQDVKDQRLKANYNSRLQTLEKKLSGSRCQRSKIESKSQHSGRASAQHH